MERADQDPGGDPYAPLLAAAAAGDMAAFRTLHDAAGPKLLGIARRILRRPELAEEALQEGFLRIWRNAARFDQARGSGFTWMAVIVRRVALDRIPAARQEDPIDEELAERLGIEQSGIAPEPRLRPCLGTLEESHRRAVILSFVYGMSHSELALTLKAPLGTAKSWVRRGLTQLRDCLGL
jgi:RNA polymerase sigma-70 factor (ECF subfamily)